jgi:uncharacterized ParB-like nuclease family protein
VSKPQSLPIEKIYVPLKKRKNLDPQIVRQIAESILEEGQRTPIHVRSDQDRFVLLDGLHRLEACKALGEGTILGTLLSSPIKSNQKPVSSYESHAEAARQNMERLKKLRVEKEAAERLAAVSVASNESVLSSERRRSAIASDSDRPPQPEAKGARRRNARNLPPRPSNLAEWIESKEREGFRF